MRIYFSGIGGVGIGPLAEIAKDSGYDVIGSDIQASSVTDQLSQKGIPIYIGQSGSEIARAHQESPIDWFVHTASVKPGHPELEFAKENGIRVSKRDELLSRIISDKKLKLIAVSGTHGKTTTTGMLVWIFKHLNIPVSYSVGTTLNFGPSGKYDDNSKYFIYECDEYDRNMLHFRPYISAITALDYDHPDTYKNIHVYKDAFSEFISQSNISILWEKDFDYIKNHLKEPVNCKILSDDTNLSQITLPGHHIRQNAFLAISTVLSLGLDIPEQNIIESINSFPGVNRRFEKISEGLYSDYGHHPKEIQATLQLASEISDKIALVYQPHQNVRQHEIAHQYTDSMELADKIYWLPTYLSREDETLPIISPEELIENLTNKEKAAPAKMDGELWANIQSDIANNYLVIAMGAGSIDSWIREQIQR